MRQGLSLGGASRTTAHRLPSGRRADRSWEGGAVSGSAVWAVALPAGSRFGAPRKGEPSARGRWSHADELHIGAVIASGARTNDARSP